MSRAYLILKFAAVLALTGFASLVLWDVHLRLKEAGPLLTDARRTLLVVGGAASNIEKILREERAASKEQFAASTAMLQEAKATIVQAKRLIANTDRSVNNELVPRLNLALESTNNLGRVSAEGIQHTVSELEPILLNLGRASAAASDTLADPSIRQAVDNLAAASAGMADSSRSLAGVTANAKEASDIAVAKLREVTKPASLAKRIFLTMLDFGYKFRAVLGF